MPSWRQGDGGHFLIVRQMLQRTLHAAKMVDVTVGKDNRPYRFVSEVFPGKQKGFPGGFASGQNRL